MEYSIGSLSDLITGSITPNKPKVVQKEFKKAANHTDSVSPKLKKNPTKNIAIQNIKKEKLNNNKNKHNNKSLNKLPNNNSENGGESFKNTKIKKSKKKVKTEVEAEDPESIKQPRKQKKRKLDNGILSEPNNSVSEASEESPTKKIKLNKKSQNAEQQVKNQENIKNENRANVEELERTLYVGNIPIDIDKKKVRQHFRKYGLIEAIRIRGVPVADPNVSKKVAAIKKEFNPKRKNIFCYIRFAEREHALKAELENGMLFQGRHLRVHICGSKDRPDENKAIFVGNLSFEAEEDELWKLFEDCGPISYVRIVRDSRSGMGKGFAYVNFKESDAVQLALEMENVTLGGRELRIALSNLRVAKKKKYLKKQQISQSGKPKERKNTENNVNGNKADENQSIKKPNAGFQGTKFGDKRKKHKVNKGLLQKKVMVKKMAPKHKTKD